MFKAVKQRTTAPLSFLKRDISDPTHPLYGTYATSRLEIDQILRDGWESIRKGNVADQKKLVQDFFLKYGALIFRAPEFVISDLTTADFEAHCKQAKNTSPSLDGWENAELSLLPTAAFDLLVTFLNRVERNGRWPSNLLFAKAGFLYKARPQDAGPRDVRILLMLPTIYRRWTSARLRNLDPWVQSWATSDMYTLPGTGAEDAWYITAIVMEHLRCHDIPLSGGASDIYKCFDQICRDLLKAILLAAGFPRRLLFPYFSMIDHLEVFNSFAGHLGEGHYHPCGIPQGCP